MAFLTEAKARLGRAEAHFDDASQHYRVVADRLREARQLVPKLETTWAEREAFASTAAADLIRQAGAAEAEALECLSDLVAALA